MWKVWVALGSAGTGVLITVCMGFMQDVRVAVILHRAIVSLLIFGGVSLGMGFLYEKFLLPYLLNKTHMTDEKAVEEAVLPEEEADSETHEESGKDMQQNDMQDGMEEEQQEFSPFTAENLNHVSPPGS